MKEIENEETLLIEFRYYSLYSLWINLNFRFLDMKVFIVCLFLVERLYIPLHRSNHDQFQEKFEEYDKGWEKYERQTIDSNLNISWTAIKREGYHGDHKASEAGKIMQNNTMTKVAPLSV